ncbi:PEP-CTERM sorting domain-containing protein, partial [Marinobacter alexandrii]|uniref:PEP-CTERM sorting domain-containing protein n=1 Tax=Marinobacter alexandrii TaxID=2570351 RepID=UPI0032968EE9
MKLQLIRASSITQHRGTFVMFRSLKGVIAAAALIFSAGSSAGLMFDPTNTGSSATATKGLEICFGCSISTTLKDLDSQTAMLEVGQTAVFDFFDITVGGLGAAFFDITATLAFASPGGSASDTGGGGFGTVIGFLSGGFLQWDGPVSVDLGVGTVYTVAFENILTGGLGDTTTVQAEVTLDRISQVPEPDTLALLGISLVGFGLSR